MYLNEYQFFFDQLAHPKKKNNNNIEILRKKKCVISVFVEKSIKKYIACKN